ncbi:MAG: site-specific integrase, partial [Verrucomicrobiaceae bacterium]
IWNACRDGAYGSIVKILMLTGQRREEVGGMAWSEIEIKQALWSLPRERTKNDRPHDVPLSALAVAVIEAIPKRPDRELVFGEGEGPFSGWSKSKAALDRRISVAQKKAALTLGQKLKPMPPWRLHDLRRTMATRMGDLGIGPHIIEAALNHISGARAGIAGIYNRSLYSAEKRAALNVWGEHLLGLVSGQEAKVVPLHKVRAG